jgi:hypothetical protein
MILLFWLLPLFLLLPFLKWNEDVMPSTSAAKTAKRREERRRQRQRENERKQLVEPKGPDTKKLTLGIAEITKRVKPPLESYESLIAFQARMLLALSNFVFGQRNKCYYHNALLRDIHSELIGYVVIPNWKIMREIAKLSKGKILSLGSGNAAFEACLLPFILSKRFCNIICTDISVNDRAFMSVIKMDSVLAVQRFGSIASTCLICWPDLDKAHTLDALKKRGEPFPCIIYVGEPRGGCCGTKELFDYLEVFYTLVKKILIKSFSGDSVYIYYLK